MVLFFGPWDFKFNFLQFSQTVFYKKSFVAQTSIAHFLFFSFYSKVEKLIILANYKAIILIFLVNFSMGFICNFRKKKLQIQPPYLKNLETIV